ncbi:MAG: MarC family protein [Cyanobacteria bacterium P01_A01_bin.114]
MSFQDFIDFVLGSLAALFPVVDPIGSVPIFLVLTAGVPQSLRYRYAQRIALYVILLLVGFLLLVHRSGNSPAARNEVQSP